MAAGCSEEEGDGVVRETVVEGAEAEFDSSVAEEEEGVSVVPAVKGAEHIVVGSYPA